MYLVFLLLLTPLQDKKAELLKAIEKNKSVKSYEYRITIRSGSGKQVIDGIYADKAIWVRSQKGEVVKKGGRVLYKSSGDWKELKGPALRKVGKFSEPHLLSEQLVRKAPAVKKEKSARVNQVLCDVYVYTLGAESAKNAFKSVWGGLIDWSNTKSGTLFYVGRGDKRIYQIELRRNSTDPWILIEFSRYNRMKLPKDAGKALKSVASGS